MIIFIGFALYGLFCWFLFRFVGGVGRQERRQHDLTQLDAFRKFDLIEKEKTWRTR